MSRTTRELVKVYVDGYTAKVYAEMYHGHCPVTDPDEWEIVDIEEIVDEDGNIVDETSFIGDAIAKKIQKGEYEL